MLKDVSFLVNRGETGVIMGRSGVGKSVSLKLLLGFLKADSGEILSWRKNVTDWTEKQFEEIRRKVTMVFQSGALFDSLTVAENVAFPLERNGGRSAEEIDARRAGSSRRCWRWKSCGPAAGRSEHGNEARGGDRTSAGGKSGGDSVRRADDDGRSDDGRAHERFDRAAQGNVPQDFDRGDTRHAPGEEAGGPRGFSAGRQRRFFRPWKELENSKDPFCAIFCSRTN